jgi:hypothetical protein
MPTNRILNCVLAPEGVLFEAHFIRSNTVQRSILTPFHVPKGSPQHVAATLRFVLSLLCSQHILQCLIYLITINMKY